MTTDLEKPIGFECRFITHVNSKHNGGDAHFIKEIQHFKDGTTKPFLRRIDNFKRDIYTTKPGAQNHKSKKEFETLGNLNRYQTTERDKLRTAARALGQPWFKGKMRDLANSPYLYGSDINTSSIIKKRYMDKYKELNTRYSVAIFDVETDVVRNPKIKEITMATISFKERAYTAVQKEHVKGYPNAVELIKKIADNDESIRKTLKDRNINWEIEIVDTEIDVVKKTIAKAHEWKPDLLACWNILFDMERIVEACDRANVDPAIILNDPSVPEEYRHFYFKIGPAKRITASGVLKPFKNSERWHTVDSPASFYWVDAMCLFRQIRTGQQEEPSYALDAILRKYAKISKAKFDVCSKYSGLDWHVQMQKNFPLHYVVYNLFDCVGVEILDEKTVDMSVTFGLYAGTSDFSRFNSQPKRKVDHLHFFLLERRGAVIAACGSEMGDGFDHLTVPLKGWITMLDPHLVVLNGLRCIEENPNQTTNIHPGTSDLDVSAAYPTNQVIANVSKRTTVCEFVRIEGMPREVFKYHTINFSSGHVNALEFCQGVFGTPQLVDMEEAFVNHLTGQAYQYTPPEKLFYIREEIEAEIEIEEEVEA